MTQDKVPKYQVVLSRSFKIKLLNIHFIDIIQVFFIEKILFFLNCFQNVRFHRMRKNFLINESFERQKEI
jgi:hypothetical protein